MLTERDLLDDQLLDLFVATRQVAEALTSPELRLRVAAIAEELLELARAEARAGKASARHPDTE